MEKFNVVVEQENEIFIIRLFGELDADTAVIADDTLQTAVEKSKKALVIDCSDLHYISSSGLGVILAALHACTQHKKDLVLYGLQDKIKNVFTILGLHKVVKMVSSKEDALNSLNTNS